MATLATVTEVLEFVETDLPDSILQRILDTAEADVLDYVSVADRVDLAVEFWSGEYTPALGTDDGILHLPAPICYYPLVRFEGTVDGDPFVIDSDFVSVPGQLGSGYPTTDTVPLAKSALETGLSIRSYSAEQVVLNANGGHYIGFYPWRLWVFDNYETARSSHSSGAAFFFRLYTYTGLSTGGTFTLQLSDAPAGPGHYGYTASPLWAILASTDEWTEFHEPHVPIAFSFTDDPYAADMLEQVPLTPVSVATGLSVEAGTFGIIPDTPHCRNLTFIMTDTTAGITITRVLGLQRAAVPAKLKSAVLDLVQLAVQNRGGITSERVGQYAISPADYHRERDMVLQRLVFAGSESLVR